MTKISRFSVGHKVAVIDDDIQGEVTRIETDRIYLVDQTGFEYWYAPKELVLIEKNQHELSKYQDINNPLLDQKIHLIDKKKRSVKRNPKDDVVLEVDLHIEKLFKDHKRLDPYDIMIIQMDTAQRKLEYAIKNRIPRLVFIHGVGEGVLEKELKYLLGRYVVSTEPADYRKYGMGATAVFIPQNTSS